MSSRRPVQGIIASIPAGRSQAIWVVETEDNQYLGTIECTGEALVVRTGYRGHPRRVHVEDVVALILATEHPEVIRS